MSGDANYSSRSLILHFNGSNGSTAFTDTGPIGHACTAVGGAQVTTAESVFGGASATFDGVGDAIDIAYSSALNLAGTDWCVEGRARATSGSGQVLVEFRGAGGSGLETQGWTIYVDQSARTLAIYDSTSLTTPIATPTDSVPVLDTWYSWAVSQEGGLTRMFIDGVLLASTSTFTTRATHSSGIRLGLEFDGDNGWIGQFDELRITKGIPVRTATYTVDGAAFPDTAQPGSVTGLASTVAFGTATAARSALASGADPSTVFGAARSGLFYPATAAEFPTAFGTARGGYRYVVGAWTATAAFGTPVLSLNRVCAAASIQNTTGVGTPFAFRGIVPEPVGLAQSLDVPTRFGLARAVHGVSCAATGFKTTAIPGHGLRLTQAAGAWTVSTAFGTPGPRRGGVATGFTTTVFGQPQIGATGLPQGFTMTAFGSHTARALFNGTATGFSTTQIPAITTSAAPSLRTRGARFRQAWGVAQAERTAP